MLTVLLTLMGSQINAQEKKSGKKSEKKLATHFRPNAVGTRPSIGVPIVRATNGSTISAGNRRPTLPFAPGEKLVYDVKYMGVSSGTAIFSVLDSIKMNGQEVYPLLSTAQSGDFSSVFYAVNDRVESYLDVHGLYSHAIKVQQHEGKKKRNKQIKFNQVEHKAIQTENAEQQIFDIPSNVNDSLSSLYIARITPLTVGASVFIDVHDGGKNYRLEVAVIKKEPIVTPIGIFDTVKVQATPHHAGTSSNKGNLTLWMTDDDKRIPVLMKSKIKFGSVTTTLISRRDGTTQSKEG
jgi:hypothetical protein